MKTAEARAAVLWAAGTVVILATEGPGTHALLVTATFAIFAAAAWMRDG